MREIDVRPSRLAIVYTWRDISRLLAQLGTPHLWVRRHIAATNGPCIRAAVVTFSFGTLPVWAPFDGFRVHRRWFGHACAPGDPFFSWVKCLGKVAGSQRGSVLPTMGDEAQRPYHYHKRWGNRASADELFVRE